MFTHQEKPLAYALLLLAFGTAILSASLWMRSNRLEEENSKLKAARYAANDLLETWPEIERFDFTSSGEFRGIVISGMAFLESHQDVFPETYQTAKILVFDELEVSKNTEENWMAKRIDLQEAAEVIVTTIKSIRIPKHNN